MHLQKLQAMWNTHPYEPSCAFGTLPQCVIFGTTYHLFNQMEADWSELRPGHVSWLPDKFPYAESRGRIPTLKISEEFYSRILNMNRGCLRIMVFQTYTPLCI